MEKRLVLMIGVQGAGKSTYVNKYLHTQYNHRIYGHQLLCLDDIRLSLGDTFNQRTEPIIRAFTDVMGRAYMERGLDIVIDGVNTSKYIIQKWKKLGDEYGYKLIGIHIDTPFETCVERRLGKNKVTQEVLDYTQSYLHELLELTEHYFDQFITVKGENGDFRESI